MKRAFTLIELLVVIVVIAVLAALTAGGLADARRQALRTKCLSHAGSCGAAISMYAEDFRGTYPLFAERRLGDAFENGGFPLSYFHQSHCWPIVVRPYLTDRELDPAQMCPGSPTYREAFGGERSYQEVVAEYPVGATISCSYSMMYGAFSDPVMWRPGGSMREPTLFRAVRTDEVTFPSQKGLLLERHATHLPGDPYGYAASISIDFPEGQRKAFTVCFGDGSVATIAYTRFLGPERGAPWEAPVLTTTDGARGRDVADRR